jgi:glycosyltransferase involved in cell wall biosynthesis
VISVIIPANNEEDYIGACLSRILASDPAQEGAPPVQVIVVANGCTDLTVAEATAKKPEFEARGWQLDVLDLDQGSKVLALNAGDAAAIYPGRVYIDADVHVSSGLITGLIRALDRSEPAYACGSPGIRPAQSHFSERYARFWEKLPFMTTGAPGCGVYGVNGAGRARWGEFPPVIADDTFVRYQFSAPERHRVDAAFTWPITEGFSNLVQVRRRQDLGLEEIRRLLPDRAATTERTSPGLRQKLSLLMRDPVGFSCYVAVALAVKTPFWRNRTGWHRGR